jgi:hypothetical protein
MWIQDQHARRSFYNAYIYWCTALSLVNFVSQNMHQSVIHLLKIILNIWSLRIQYCSLTSTEIFHNSNHCFLIEAHNSRFDLSLQVFNIMWIIPVTQSYRKPIRSNQQDWNPEDTVTKSIQIQIIHDIVQRRPCHESICSGNKTKTFPPPKKNVSYSYIHPCALKSWKKWSSTIFWYLSALAVSSWKTGATIPPDGTAHRTAHERGCRGVSMTVWGA